MLSQSRAGGYGDGEMPNFLKMNTTRATRRETGFISKQKSFIGLSATLLNLVAANVLAEINGLSGINLSMVGSRSILTGVLIPGP